MNMWFIVYLCLQMMGIGLSLAKHGEPKKENYNFWVSLIATIISTIIVYMAIKTGF